MKVNKKATSQGSCLVLAIIAIFLLVEVGSVNSQEGSKADPRRSISPEDTTSTPSTISDVPYYSPNRPVDCETANFYIDDAVRRVQKTNNTRLIVIARLGAGETAQHLNTIRIKAVKTYLRRYDDIKAVLAEGDRTKGYGCLEFYVGGKLLYKIPIRKNANIDLFSCAAA